MGECEGGGGEQGERGLGGGEEGLGGMAVFVRLIVREVRKDWIREAWREVWLEGLHVIM